MAAQALGDAAAASVVCAVRELFEETGVLLSEPLSPAQVAELPRLRRELIAGTRGLDTALTDLGTTLDRSLVRPAGRWITPAFLPQRYDTQYYLASLPPGQEPVVLPGELEDGAWRAPHVALEQFGQGEVLLPTPVRHALAAMGDAADGSAAIAARLSDAPGRCAPREEARLYEVVADLFVIPLATPTLPPARHTNCYVAGTRTLAIIDPGTPYHEDREVLHRALAMLASEGRAPWMVVLTHHHEDHVGAAAHLRERYHIPVAAHPRTAEALRGTLAIDHLLRDGEELTLGSSRQLRVVATPGHAPGHVSLWDAARRALLCGDLLSTAGFVVIDPRDGGEMADYLASLERVRALGPRLVLPAHGLPALGATTLIDDYLAHRRWREARIATAVATAPGPLDEAALLPLVYDDTPRSLWPLATQSLLAHLIKLERDGRVARREDGWVTA